MFPTIETKRLKLRELRLEDTLDLFHYFSKDEVTKYYDLDSFTELSQAENLITNWQERFNNEQGIRFGITLNNEDHVIGTCGFHNLSRKHFKAEIGYELSPEYWRQGIMREVLDAILIYGFEDLGLNRIGALIDPNNISSRLLLEKSGFKEEGILNEYYYKQNRFVDAVIFSKLKKNYK
ncbi:GNAT family N-acetyltransferase [Paenibacillus tarimensis]|uniref:GNAT family N-acetyltransferase n=1 Tax=Paenibacillus tarimensis TaxID=416012 RepID=UPI001F3B8B7D|nr:GNAT family protein [Paenibacillus tarimensis]MCF2946431.1 GNAT family N-acetyltransferase [Paenibacillus tarimensis]